MIKYSFKKYAGITVSLFGAAALSLLLFFALFRIDAISSFFSHICKTLMPFIIGCSLAYILRSLCNKLEAVYDKAFCFIKNDKKRNSIASNLSIFSSLLIAALFIIFVIMIIIPNLVNSVVRLIQIIPANAHKVINYAQTLLSRNELLASYSEQAIEKTYQFINDFLNNEFLGYVQSLATGVSNGVISVFVVIFNTFVGFIIAAYLLSSRKKLARQLKLIIFSIFKKDTAKYVIKEMKNTDLIFSGFIIGKILDAIVIALVTYIGMSIFSIANPDKEMMNEMLIAVIVGVFNVIPFFGWYIAWFIGALLCLIVNPVQCIFFIIFDFILQQIDGNIIGPKILGNSTGISSLWVLFAILFFGDIWGFAGMLLGVPVFAVIYHLIKVWVFKRLEINGVKELKEEYERYYPEKDDRIN